MRLTSRAMGDHPSRLSPCVLDCLGEPHMQPRPSSLERQVADVLRRARRWPTGADRNDLRQLAAGLLSLRHYGMDALVEDRRALTPEMIGHDSGDRPRSS